MVRTDEKWLGGMNHVIGEAVSFTVKLSSS